MNDIVLILGAMYGNRKYIKYFNGIHQALLTSHRNLVCLELSGNSDVADAEFDIIPYKTDKKSWLSFKKVRKFKEHNQALIEMEVGQTGDNAESQARSLLYFEIYFSYLIFKLRPKLVLLGHEFTALYIIARKICDKARIDSAFYHPGILPGTFCFEFDGQMGNSWVCRQSSIFSEKPIDEKDQLIAKKYIELARAKKYVRPRHDQSVPFTDSNFDAEKQNQKKVVLYVGCNDFRTGFAPRSLRGAHWHSPFLDSSYAGLLLLSEICKKNGWHLIYKPHPNYAIREPKLCSEYHVTYAKDVSIYDLLAHCDVCCTILSSVSYEALIQECPVVLLGRTALSGKNIVYEAYDQGDVECCLKNALNDARAFNYERFEQHVARLLKYYLCGMHDDIIRLTGCGYIEAVNKLNCESNKGTQMYHLPNDYCYLSLKSNVFLFLEQLNRIIKTARHLCFGYIVRLVGCITPSKIYLILRAKYRKVRNRCALSD